MRIPRPSPSMAVALLALVVAVSGSSVAVAAVVIPKNSVGTQQLKKDAVTAKKVKAGAITGPKLGSGAVTAPKLGANAVSGGKVADGSLTGADVKNGSITASDIAAGVLGGGGPRAYGTVQHNPVSLLGEHPGIVSVRRPATGVYCLTLAAGIAAQNNHAVATVDHGYSQGVTNFVQVVGESNVCEVTESEVLTFNADGNAVNGIAFNLVVP